MTQIIPNGRFPVLAYPECDAASPVSLSLVFKYNERRAQATLCLLSSLFICACEDAQTFMLQYDADNMVPGRISLGPATIPLPQDRLDGLAREGNPQIRTLSLTLRKACPVWCLLPSGPLTPRPGCEAPFHQLAKLAEARELHVVFDYNRLHRNHHTSFQRLIEHPEQLSGFPVGQRYGQQQFKCVDWSVFSSGGADADATTEDEEPLPVYAEACRKRPRDVSTSPPLSPPPKRVLLSPYQEGAHTSPTDKASVPTPPLAAWSPKPPSLAVSSPQPANLPTTPTPDLQRAVEEAVSTLLPSIVATLLPSVLPRLLAASSPTPSSQQSIASQMSHAPPPPRLSALGISLHDRLGSRMESELGNIYAHTLGHANYLRNTAALEFEGVLEEGRLHFDMEKQDAVYEVERVVDEKLQALREECDNLVDYVEERAGQKADHVVDHVRERLDELVREKVSLERERKELREDREELRRDKVDIRRDKQDVRREREDLRAEREILQRDQTRFKSEQRRAAGGNRRGERRNRAGSAPA